MTASYIGSAANAIASAFQTNHGQDPYLAAAVRLADQQMLLSPEVAAEIADADRDVWVAQLELDLIELTRVADTKQGGQQAGMLLAIGSMHALLRRVRSSRARPVTPEVEAMIRASKAIEQEVTEPEAVAVCHVCGDRYWLVYVGLSGGRWVCAGRCDKTAGGAS